MIKLNRTTEYGLIALRHIGRKRLENPTAVTSAREIADTYGLPFEITAKTLQRLKERGLIQSEQGARGGYLLARALDQVSLSEFMTMMEGPQLVVPCAQRDPSDQEADRDHGADCEYSSRCEMRGVLTELNSRVRNFLSGIRLSELAGTPGARETLMPSFNPTFATTAALPGTASSLSRRLGDEP